MAEVPHSSSRGSCTRTTLFAANSRQVAFTSSAVNETPVKVPMRSWWPGTV